MDMREKKISSEIMFDGKILRVERDKVLCPNGNESFREIIRHNGGAAILCVTPDDKVLLEKQFRYAYDEVIYEIPAGKLELNEDPYDAAMREFEEETGNKAKELIPLGHIYPTCGYSAEKIYLYLALDFVQTEKNLDEDEVIITEYVPLAKVKEMILNNEIKDAKTICALNYYFLKYNK